MKMLVKGISNMNLKLQLLVLLITISFSSMVFSNSIEAPELSNFAKAKQNALEVIDSAEVGDAVSDLHYKPTQCRVKAHNN